MRVVLSPKGHCPQCGFLTHYHLTSARAYPHMHPEKLGGYLVVARYRAFMFSAGEGRGDAECNFIYDLLHGVPKDT